MPKKSNTPCKPGKSPTGKNGRCVNNRTKKTNKCKPGKSPTGKNGRCVKTSSRTKSRSSSKTKKLGTRQIIKNFMDALDDDDFFTKKEIDEFVATAASRKLTKSEIKEGLEQYPKNYGVFAY